MSNIFAHTKTDGAYPAYISVNETRDGQISITVRSTRQPDGREGSCATIHLSRAEFRECLISYDTHSGV